MLDHHYFAFFQAIIGILTRPFGMILMVILMAPELAHLLENLFGAAHAVEPVAAESGTIPRQDHPSRDAGVDSLSPPIKSSSSNAPLAAGIASLGINAGCSAAISASRSPFHGGNPTATQGSRCLSNQNSAALSTAAVSWSSVPEISSSDAALADRQASLGRGFSVGQPTSAALPRGVKPETTHESGTDAHLAARQAFGVDSGAIEKESTTAIMVSQQPLGMAPFLSSRKRKYEQDDPKDDVAQDVALMRTPVGTQTGAFYGRGGTGRLSDSMSSDARLEGERNVATERHSHSAHDVHIERSSGNSNNWTGAEHLDSNMSNIESNDVNNDSAPFDRDQSENVENSHANDMDVSISDVEWKEGQAYRDLTSQLTQMAEQHMHCLKVDEKFISCFLELSTDHVKELPHALSKAKVSEITIADIPFIHRNSEARFQELCEVLTTMRGVKTVTISADNHFFSSNHAKIVGSLRQVESLSIWILATNEVAMQTLAAHLAKHGRLKSLMLAVPGWCYHLLLPAVQTISSLTNLILSWSWSMGLRHLKVDPTMASAMARLFRMGPTTNPDFQVTFRYWNFSIPASCNILCSELSHATIRGVSLHACSFASSSHLAEALTQSKLRAVMFLLLRFTEGSVAQFLNCLAQGISSMAQLENLECSNVGSPFDKGRIDEAMVQLTQAVAQCPQLRYLALDFCNYPEHLDTALAECLSPVNSRLEELNIWCDSLDSETAARVTQSPFLLEALKTNYTIRYIYLHTKPLLWRRQIIARWDPLLKKSIETYPKLNRAGRSYVTRDAMDKKAGCRVLEAVNDDLDCLFYHLRVENPILCDRHAGALQPRESKRQADALQARGRKRPAPS